MITVILANLLFPVLAIWGVTGEIELVRRYLQVLAFVGSIALVAWIFFPQQIPGFSRRARSTIRVDAKPNVLVGYERVTKLWNEKCAERGFRSAGIYFIFGVHPSPFGVSAFGLRVCPALTVPHALTLARLSTPEINAILEHEMAHLRLNRVWKREFTKYLCLPGKMLSAALRRLRISLLRHGACVAAEKIFTIERVAFLLTDRFVGQAEEHAADALAALVMRKPESLERALLALSRKDPDELTDELALIQRFLVSEDFQWVKIANRYDEYLSSHPTITERQRKLRSYVHS